MQRRRGSMALVLVFAVVMAMVVMGMMQLASSLYTTSRDSARYYSDIQCYRAASEMSCYQYITDLEAVTVTKDLDAEWLSITGFAIYSQAVDSIQGAIADDEDTTMWYVHDVRNALNAANLSDASVLTNLLGKLAGVHQSFNLSVPEPLTLDLEHEDSWYNSKAAHVKISPFVVEIMLQVRGETVSDVFVVDGIYLDVQVDKRDVGGSNHNIVVASFTEEEEGVSITRAIV